MLTNPYQQNGAPGFIGDTLTRDHVLPGGARINATLFTPADAIAATVGVAGAATGATSVPIAALLAPIPSGALLDFGARAATTVTLSANAAQGATSISFAALSRAIPSGTVLDFGGAKFARTAAAAAASATSVAVAALPTALSSGDVATVPAVSARTAKVAADAAKGASSLTVEALPESLVSGDVAYYTPPGVGRRIAAGTLVGCTYAELEAAPALTGGVPGGLLWGPAADSDDIVYFTVYDITDADKKPDADLLRHGSLIFVNHVPGWSNLSSALKAKVRAQYECTVGATEV